MKKGSVVVNYLMVALVVFGIGFYMGGSGCSYLSMPEAPDVSAEDRYNVPLENSPAKGSPSAVVTIVEFSDFECPFCKRAADTVKQVVETYGEKVRVVFKNNPLPFHKNAMVAAEAGMAAGEQGKFWEMHDKMFENNRALTREDLDGYAQSIGLDMGKYKEAMDSHKFQDRIKKDMDAAQTFAAAGTPHFFINGRRLSGAQPIEEFKKVIDEEISRFAALGQSAMVRDVYSLIVQKAKTKAEGKKQDKKDQERKPPQEDTNVYKISTGDKKSAKGAVEDALITIVEFSDYQCPFCSKAEVTMKQVMEDYKGKIRLFFRQNPLPFHQQAKPAAKAALAARNQGKFWEMHEKMFANQKDINPENIEKWAQEIGLNVAKFKADMESPAMDQEIEKDQKEAEKFGARGTPAFFINGRKITGAQPIENFKKLIDTLLPVAEGKGMKGDALYAELTKDGKEGSAPPPGQQQEDPNKVYTIDPGKSPWKGGKSAKVTIVIFSDYECPFCSRVEGTLSQIEKEYGDKVKFVFKNYPLPFHKNAQLAAEAAHAAGEQGKFWEMHDKLFQNNKALTRDDILKYAQELGLKVDKFTQALDAGVGKSQIEDDKKVAQTVGVSGTPAFFINGKKLVGAQPFESFKKLIDEALAK